MGSKRERRSSWFGRDQKVQEMNQWETKSSNEGSLGGNWNFIWGLECNARVLKQDTGRRVAARDNLVWFFFSGWFAEISSSCVCVCENISFPFLYCEDVMVWYTARSSLCKRNRIRTFRNNQNISLKNKQWRMNRQGRGTWISWRILHITFVKAH